MVEENKKWLVKSNSSVVGPFHFDDVVEAIFKGDIHVLDEIQGPFERWRPIRDHSLFAAAIEKLKASAYGRRENTITENIDSFTQTATMEFTQTATDVIGGQTQTSTGDITSSGAKAPQPSAPREQQYYPEPPAPEPIGIKKHSSRFPFAFIMTIVLIIAGIIILKFGDLGKSAPQGAERDRLFEEYTNKGLALLKTGEFKESLQFFSKAREINPGDPDLTLEMAPLLIQVDHQYAKVADMVGNLLGRKFQKEYMKRGKNIVGMSFSYRGQENEALNEINKSLEVDGEYYSALINKGYLEIKMRRAGDAIETLSRAVKISPNEAIGTYLRARALIADGLRTRSEKNFTEVISSTSKFVQESFDFRQEALFFRAIAQQNKRVSGKDLTGLVRGLLSQDPELTNLHVHQISWDFQSFDWGEFQTECQSLASGLGRYNSQLLLGFCQYKSGKVLEAKKIFEGLMSEKSKDGILQALYTSSLFALNDPQLAKNGLKILNNVERGKPLAEVLLRGCIQNNDIPCVRKVVQSNPGRRMTLLYSYWAAFELNKKSKKEKARKAHIQGQRLSPYFAPFLKVRGRL